MKLLYDVVKILSSEGERKNPGVSPYFFLTYKFLNKKYLKIAVIYLSKKEFYVVLRAVILLSVALLFAEICTFQ